MSWLTSAGSYATSGGGKLAGDIYGRAIDQADSHFASQQQFSWNGKDMRRNIRFQKRMIRFQNEQSKMMSLWAAQNMPAATMRGLKSAGLNPLLAATQGSAPMVASSAANVPYSESYQPSQANTDGKAIEDLFTGVGPSAKEAEKATNDATVEQANANKETARANAEEQRQRKEFLSSNEGKSAVKQKMRQDYSPQSVWNLASQLMGAAKDVIPNILSLPALNEKYEQIERNQDRVERRYREKSERIKSRKESDKEKFHKGLIQHNKRIQRMDDSDKRKYRLFTAPQRMKGSTATKLMLDGIQFTDY